MAAQNFTTTANFAGDHLADEGEEISSNFAPHKQQRYKLEDGRTWYASLAAATKVDNLGVAVGEPFRVCMREYEPGKSVLDVLQYYPDSNAQTKFQPLELRHRTALCTQGITRLSASRSTRSVTMERPSLMLTILAPDEATATDTRPRRAA